MGLATHLDYTRLGACHSVTVSDQVTQLSTYRGPECGHPGVVTPPILQEGLISGLVH